MDKQEYDPAKIEALEEVTFHTSNAFEALLNLLIEKGVVSEREIIDKMDSLIGHDEDDEELGFDANAPRDPEDPE